MSDLLNCERQKSQYLFGRRSKIGITEKDTRMSTDFGEFLFKQYWIQCLKDSFILAERKRQITKMHLLDLCGIPRFYNRVQTNG